jgi:hypothetical protein
MSMAPLRETKRKQKIEFSLTDENARPMVTGRTVEGENRDASTLPSSPSLRNHHPPTGDGNYD